MPPEQEVRKHEKELQKGHIDPHPEEVSPDSTTHQVFHEKGVPEAEEDVDMMAGIRGDLVRCQGFSCNIV